jgi:hypothetical protein
MNRWSHTLLEAAQSDRAYLTDMAAIFAVYSNRYFRDFLDWHLNHPLRKDSPRAVYAFLPLYLELLAAMTDDEIQEYLEQDWRDYHV